MAPPPSAPLVLRRALLAAAALFCACGTPATPPDAGGEAQDSGAPTDSGAGGGGASDAGRPDSGAPDAGGPDSGAPDSGASDAGAADSGAPSDAGLDAGQPDSGAGLDAGAVHVGALVGGAGAWPGFIEGVRYRSGSQCGFTDDAGTFHWEDGSPVVFSVDDVDLRPAAGAALLSAWQLSAAGTCAETAELERLLVLLQSLDTDGSPDSGTSLTPYPAPAATRPFSSLTDADVAALVAQKFAGRTPVATLDAVDRFIVQVDSELWAQLGLDTFTGLVAYGRSQGVTTNGASWFFSYQYGLQRTDLAYNVQQSNLLAIPGSLAGMGSNHIGDIDLNGTTLWAPVEDGTAYQHPYLVEYDATSLSAGATHALSNTLLTKGVPWVAVDAPRQSLYVAEWDPTPSIYVYSLVGVSYVTSIPIRPTLTRIQGAKIFEGNMYADVDTTAKTVWKINLETGTAQPLFELSNAAGTELEGLAVLARPDGSLLHTLNATAARTAMEFRHHQRTRDPLRKRLCP